MGLVDVAFVDEENKIIKIIPSTPKGKMSPIVKESKYVIEARSGEFKAKNLEKGDEIKITPKD